MTKVRNRILDALSADWQTCTNVLPLERRVARGRDWGAVCNTLAPIGKDLPILCPFCRARVDS